MQLLQELIQINRDAELEDIFEELGNLGKLGLGPMVNAFKQSYSTYSKGREGIKMHTGEEGSKFNRETAWTIGKDSESVDAGTPKNWNTIKKFYTQHADDKPVAAIVKVDDNPVALMIAAGYDLNGVNDKVVLAWDFSKVAPTEEEAKQLTAGLNTDTSDGRRWRTEVIGTTAKAGVSARKEDDKEKDYDFKKGDYVEKFTSKKYTGFTQTVREVAPFMNNICKAFGTRVSVTLILADKVRANKRKARLENPPIATKDITLFRDDLSTRLAKYKNTKIDSAESAEEFITKVFGGGLKKLKFAGRAYSAVPDTEYETGSGSGKHKYFYNGTMQKLFLGKPVTMKFSADSKEGDYNSLYLTVKLVNGALKPVEVRYSDKEKGGYGSSESIKF